MGSLELAQIICNNFYLMLGDKPLIVHAFSAANVFFFFFGKTRTQLLAEQL